MGRKRIEKKKKKITISVDPDVLEFLIKHEINRSVIFNDAAKAIIQEYSKHTNK